MDQTYLVYSKDDQGTVDPGAGVVVLVRDHISHIVKMGLKPLDGQSQVRIKF